MEEKSNVSSAVYPLPQPISFILRHAVLQDSNQTGHQSSPDRKISLQKDDMNVAFEHLIRNSFVAIDELYFSTPSVIRNTPPFQHRLCIRISVNPNKRTLSVTDLGCGMSRADLINSLAAGRLSSRVMDSIRSLSIRNKTPNESEHHPLDYKDDDATESDDSFFGDDDHEKSQKLSTIINGNGVRAHAESKNEPYLIPCQSTDIGSFYAALCSLGTSVEVATKSKFDDYYVLNIGDESPDQDMGDGDERFTHFRINRPLSEGTRPSLDHGFNKFDDVRGESGTRVTISLSQAAIDAGFLNEREFLVPLVARVLEKSPYHVAFEGCSSVEECNSIISANNREEMEIDYQTDHMENSLIDGPYNIDIDPYASSVKERSKFIPLRLSLGERKMLRLVEAAMVCSDYTSNVDKLFSSSARRTHTQLKGISSILRGLVIACDHNAGKVLAGGEDFKECEVFVKKIFEIARRHKIMNPEKMRTEYGKLIYLMQDAVSPAIQQHLSISCKGTIESVYSFLEERDGLAVLEDKLIRIATEEVLPEKKSRDQIAAEIKRKEKAVAYIKQKYRSSQLSTDDIHLCLYSISDNESFLNSNRVPIDKMISYLQALFTPGRIDEGYSLSIVSGTDGHRLTHSHDRQYYFILQSLTLWRDIINDMFRLWAMAEEDLLSEAVSYNLIETGQGLQRVQQSPRTYKAMQQILSNVQKKVKNWVGSSVIHLGDHNVPNALHFIDKYTQVPRILGPIISCLEQTEKLYKNDEGVKMFINEGFGSFERLTKDILYDFFKSAFDGSGADNFYDAGSCIDGRLTSAWNWASRIAEKEYYCIFRLSGFYGFDGEFK